MFENLIFFLCSALQKDLRGTYQRLNILLVKETFSTSKALNWQLILYATCVDDSV